MPDLFSLPLELRYLIYGYLAESDRKVLDSPKACGRLKKLMPNKDLLLGQKTQVTYEPLIKIPSTRTFIITNWTSLVQVNKQIRSELTTYIQFASAKSGQTRYKLDIMVDQDYIYPTWLYFPYPAEHVDVLEVDFRVFQDCGPQDRFKLKPGLDKVSFPPERQGAPIALTLLMLLRRFIMNKNDQFNTHNHRNPKPRSIGKIIIDFRMPDHDLLLAFWLRWFGWPGVKPLLTSTSWGKIMEVFHFPQRFNDPRLCKGRLCTERMLKGIMMLMVETINRARSRLHDDSRIPSFRELEGVVGTIEVKIDGEISFTVKL